MQTKARGKKNKNVKFKPEAVGRRVGRLKLSMRKITKVQRLCILIGGGYINT